jgi:hypothetical protein
MKNALIYYTLTFLFIFGCTKEPTPTENINKDSEEKRINNLIKKDTQTKQTNSEPEPQQKEEDNTDKKPQKNKEKEVPTDKPDTANQKKSDELHLANKISEYLKGDIEITIEDLHQNNIYQVSPAKIPTFNQLLYQQPIETINTEKKLLKWINSQFPKTYTLVFFVPNHIEIDESIKESAAKQASIFFIEINKNTNILSLYPLTGEVTSTTNHWHHEDDPIKTSTALKAFINSAGKVLIEQHVEHEILWSSAIAEQNDGSLFNGLLLNQDVKDVLHYWTRELKRKNIEMIDISFFNHKTSYSAYLSFCQTVNQITSNPTNESPEPPESPETFITELLKRINQSTDKNIPKIFYYNKEEQSNIENILVYDCKNTLTFNRYLTHYLKPYKSQNDRNDLPEITKDVSTYNYIESTDIEEKNYLIEKLNNLLKVNNSDKNQHTTIP